MFFCLITVLFEEFPLYVAYCLFMIFMNVHVVVICDKCACYVISCLEHLVFIKKRVYRSFICHIDVILTSCSMYDLLATKLYLAWP